MKTKNYWKLLAAAFAICLPFAFTACSSDDDEDEGPELYQYSWSLDNTTKADATIQEQQAILNACVEINKIVASQLQSEGFQSVDVNKQTFEIETEKDIKDYDDKVVAVAYVVKANSTVKSYLQVMPDNVALTFKRSGKKFDSVKLK
ncbi:MAG: hypothetical protein J5486_00685 [Bacteroidaceae bacterium]|nr:hypothetical protein [Bacteroidaceae bacterium]